MDVRQSVLMLLLSECVILVCQKVRLGFLNVRSVRTLAAFSITQRISALCLTLTEFFIHQKIQSYFQVMISDILLFLTFPTSFCDMINDNDARIQPSNSTCEFGMRRDGLLFLRTELSPTNTVLDEKGEVRVGQRRVESES